jgi:uncharacterized protein YndB with AHSA1/START domain
MAPRAEIVDTGSRWARAARIVVAAPAQDVFDVLADPAQHSAFDGSGTVQSLASGPQRLALGSRFGMRMRIKVPYRTDNTVVEFEEGRRIAWCHVNKHRWRYELEPLADGSTRVTETFDGRTALFPPSLLLINALANNQVAVAKTLVRLKDHVEHREASP